LPCERSNLPNQFRVLSGALSVLLVLGLNLLNASPKLHELVHKDAGSNTHRCAVTMFAHGQVDSASVDLARIEPSVLIEAAQPLSSSIFAPAVENLPAGRAPPAAVSSLV
jgi:hypothetical protein